MSALAHPTTASRWLGTGGRPSSTGAACRPPPREHRRAVATPAVARDGPGLATDVPASVAWDPDGLLPAPAAESHFARRERQRAEAAGATLQQQGGVRAITPEHLAEGGVLAADTSLYDRSALEADLANRFLPVDLDTPGLRIMHLDPPIFTVPGFFTDEQCDEFVDAAIDSGAMAPSKVGGGNLRDLQAAAGNSRRTSSSLLLDDSVTSAYPRLRAMAEVVQSLGLRLVGHGNGSSWGAPGKLPKPGQYCYEGLQLAQYKAGQHFLSHEDGFPPALARQSGFQRHATLLLYLNTTEQGGATRFDMLNLAVQPRKGTALLFFPAFADGTADSRSLHTAEDAVDTKWVTQQWIARGLPTAAVDPIAAALAGSLPAAARSSTAAPPARQQQQRAESEELSAAEALLAGKRGKGKGKKTGSKKAGGGKGFGA